MKWWRRRESQEWEIPIPSEETHRGRVLEARTWSGKPVRRWQPHGNSLMWEYSPTGLCSLNPIVTECWQRGWTLHSLPAAQPTTATGVRGDG